MEKTNFEDFDFRPHFAGFIAQKMFDNGWGVSVIPESDNCRYEIAILTHENGYHSHLNYDSPITDDVLRYQTLDEVHSVVSKVCALPIREKRVK